MDSIDTIESRYTVRGLLTGRRIEHVGFASKPGHSRKTSVASLDAVVLHLDDGNIVGLRGDDFAITVTPREELLNR